MKVKLMNAVKLNTEILQKKSYIKYNIHTLFTY